MAECHEEMARGEMQTRDERNKAVDNIETGKAASLWADRQTGALLILSSKADIPTFQQRQREGALLGGADFVCEITDPLVVEAVQRLNATARGIQ